MESSQYREKLSLIQKKLGPDCKLLIVSKTRIQSEIKAYYDLGHRDFGENRIPELLEKALALKDSCPDIRWHMIGNIQTNKINQLYSVPNLWAIHSVDSLEHLEKLIQAESRLSEDVKIFLQVNTSHEVEKAGFENFAEVKAAAEKAFKAKRLKLHGLMTMGTLRTEDFQAEAARCFHDLFLQKDRLESELKQKFELSMGMSQDYEIALKEKSNWIRLGTFLFV